MMRTRLTLAAVLVVIVAGMPCAGEVRTTKPSGATIVAEVYQDGNILLVLGDAKLESLPELRMADLTGASPEKRELVMREFLARKYDGVFLGAPEPPAPSKPRRCSDFVARARQVKRICRSVGSEADLVSIQNGSGGTCENGMTISLTCGDE